jgi:hypothetical protein
MPMVDLRSKASGDNLPLHNPNNRFAMKVSTPKNKSTTRQRANIHSTATQESTANASNGGPTDQPDDQRARLERIALNAYFRSRNRPQGSGNELEDWLAAEAEVDGAQDASRSQ